MMNEISSYLCSIVILVKFNSVHVNHTCMDPTFL